MFYECMFLLDDNSEMYNLLYIRNILPKFLGFRESF